MRRMVGDRYLKSGGADWTAKSMAAGSTYCSDSIGNNFARGPAAMHLVTTGGSLTVTYELSRDGLTWYEPYKGSSKINTVVASIGTVNRWITFDVSIGKYIRFKFVQADAASTVAANYMFQE